MPSLHDLQRCFADAILFGDPAAVSRLGIVGGALHADSRLALYRSNVLANYGRALAATFPVVHALIGPAFFAGTIEAFVRAHPSNRGDINRYGGDLPRFLAAYEPARELPYLPDVARLEWAIDQADIAPDTDPLDLEALAAVPRDELGTLRFLLHPSAAIMVSPYPVLRIWQTNQPGREQDAHVDLGEGGDALLVARRGDAVTIDRLAPAGRAFLQALGDGLELADALERAMAADATFDLGEALRAHVVSGTIVGFRVWENHGTGP